MSPTPDQAVTMPTSTQPQRRAWVRLANGALLAAVAVLALQHVDLPSLTGGRAATAGPLSATETAPCMGPFLIGDLRRFPCIVKRTGEARVNPMNTAIDRLGPGLDAVEGADRPLDSWEKLDHWSLGYWRRYDPFFGEDF